MFVISSSKGWSVISCQEPYFLIKEKRVFFFLSHTKSFSSFVSIVFLGLQKGYFQYLKLKGMGYKFVNTSNNIALKLGFSHRIIYVNPINTKCSFISKYFLGLEARSLWTIKKIVQSFNSIRKKNVYKKKGIFLKGCLIDIRVSSKKSKF
jgi:ribosomal protein L6P/L9E